MGHRTPAQIQRFLDENLHRLDLPQQMLGTEPNAARKPWDDTSVRWCLVASWPYEQAAGNQSIPAVYRCINDGRDDFLADRFYLPATPRDMRIMEKHHIPIFGIESKHQLGDFDVVGTSIAYPVLSMSFVKMLKMSDIPTRWRDRDAAGAENYPMVIVGGQSYGAPEVLSPVVDCWWLGEVEDELGNPGIAAVTARIADFKASGVWSTDRLACYQALAREYNFLYFPRFVDVHYHYEDRTHVGVGPHPSKQVAGYTSKLEGMRLPLVKRHVKDLDAVAPLVDPPLLFADPAMGSGDLEVARGCPAWSIPVDALVEVAGRGVVRFDTVEPGEYVRSGREYRRVAGVAIHGLKSTIRVQTREGYEVECTPEHEIQVVRGTPELADRIRATGKRRALDEAPWEWLSADALRPGDYLQWFYGGVSFPRVNRPLQDITRYEVGRPRQDGSRALRAYPTPFPVELTEAVGWFLGVVCGDSYVRGNQVDIRIENRAWPLANRLCQASKELFGIEPTASPSPDGPTTIYRLNSARLVRWLSANFGIHDNDTRKRVPDQIFGSPRAVIAAYLSALYDANGTHLEPKSATSITTIRFVSYREEFVRQVAELFRMFGLPSAVRSEARGVKRDGRPSDRSSVKWEVRTTASPDGDYDWLVSLDPFKSRHLEHFRPPVDSAHCKGQDGLVYAQVAGFADGRVVRVMDVDVPGPQAFNVNGIYVHNCSFCALSYRSKPYRQRSVPYMIEYAKRFANNMGSVRMAPFSPDFPMHTQKKALIAGLLENVSDEVDAPAMRVDDFLADSQFILLQVYGGMDSVTLGVEGNSQRMRDLAGKGTSDDDIKQAVAKGIAAGIRKFKLFMITNFPGEDEGDVLRILKLAKDLADIRESMNQPTVRIQFSWTPLMIEANTPFQWFAPSPQSRILGDIWEEFRDLKIEFKIGAKGEINKAAFFQLCQRASRDVGEALVDAMEAIDQACWGGVPRTFKDLIDEKLRAHGFLNGFDDCFDEREQHDMFGWEFIDQGIGVELLWTTYRQMREFIEQTDSATYDDNFDGSYRGAEWVARCDERCQGKRCGACDHADLKIRVGYLRAALEERDIDLSTVNPVDQRSQALRVRARIIRPEQYRFVGNDHWRFNLRRAAFRAQERLGLPHGIAKRTIRFASDETKHRDWTSGVDYVEFAITRPMPADQLQTFVATMAEELAPWMRLDHWVQRPASYATMRADVDASLYELELDEHPNTVSSHLTRWRRSDHVPMSLKVEAGYFAPGTEQVNAKAYVDDLWLVKDGFRLKLRMLIRGRPNPYNVYAALMGRTSWLDAARISAVRLEAFVEQDRGQQDFLRPSCRRCGLLIPINVLDEPYDTDHCPRCKDEHDGRTVITPAS